MKTWTVDEIMDQEPCWTRKRVRAVFNKQQATTLTTEQILRLDRIDAADRIWVATRPGALPLDVLRKFVHITADRAVRNYALNIPVTAKWAAKWSADRNRTTAEEVANETWEVVNETWEASAAGERQQQVEDLLQLISELC